MKQSFTSHLVEGAARIKYILAALCMIGYGAVILFAGGSIAELGLVWLCVGVYVFLPGCLFARILKTHTVLRDATIPYAVLLGTGFFAVLYCFAMRLQLVWLLQGVPPLLALAAVSLFVYKNKTPAALHRAKSWLRKGTSASFVLTWSFLSLLYALSISARNAHPSAAGAVTYSQDVLWNIGNANAFTFAFPPQDIRFSLVRLSYHYLTELTEGALSIVSGVSAYNIIVFYIGPIVLAAMLACLWKMALCFYEQNAKKAGAFLTLLLACNCASMLGVFELGISSFGNTNLEHLITNVNSQTTLYIFLPVFLLLFVSAARKRFDVRWLDLIILLCSFVLLCFSKGPAAAIVFCSFLITMLLVLCFQKPHYAKAVFLVVGISAVFAVVYFAVFSSGANNSTYLNYQTIWDSKPWAWLTALWQPVPFLKWFWAALAVLLNVFCWQPLQTVLFCKGLPGDCKKLFQLPAERLLANGVVAGGFLAYHLFWHPNSSQVYFALIAVFFLNLLAADQIFTRSTKLFRGLCAVLAVIGVFTTFCMVTVIGGKGVLQTARNLQMVQPAQASSYTTAQDEAAMDWLRAHTDPTVQFATNRVHSTSEATDGISNVYSALSGRQAYMEGYSYAHTNMGVSQAVLEEKMATNSALFHGQTNPDEIVRLCNEKQITHLVFSKQYPGDTVQLSLLKLVYENSDVAIFQVT